MTIPLEHSVEWQYRYDERLGILTGGDKPTRFQEAMAEADANAWLEEQLIYEKQRNPKT